MATLPVLTSQMVSKWLNPEEPNRSATERSEVSEEKELEEQNHPWKPGPRPAYFSGPLLRTWDIKSGSQPTAGDNRMVSRAPEMRLSGRETRRSTLSNHLDHKNWSPGPYISFTSSPTELTTLARKRTALEYRGLQTITAINPNTRIRNGLPVLDLEAEMGHYGIKDPYGKSMAYYRDHYVCLWQVTEAEIIGSWEWSELEENITWYEDTVLPAYRESEAAVQPTTGQVVDAADPQSELLEGFQNLSIANGHTENQALEDTDDDHPKRRGGESGPSPENE